MRHKEIPIVPTQERVEHTTLVARKDDDHVSLKEFLVGVINERERKYEQRMDAIGGALSAAFSATKDALQTANANIATALAAIDKRFESVNEFRGTLVDQQENFARKADVDTMLAAFKEATLKAEAATEKRFEGVNAFRAQLSDQQATLVRKSEVDIRFDALEKKVDTAVATLQMNKGRESGINAMWAVLAVVAGLALTGVGVAIALVTKH